MEAPHDIAALHELGDLAADYTLRFRCLSMMYKRRREQPEAPGLSLLEFETASSVQREHLMFTLWYLRDKGYASQDEHSNFVITGDGVDCLERRVIADREEKRA
jgi:hypothetical protein